MAAMLTTGENLLHVSGIYCAIHRESGNCYVGSSINIHGRSRAKLSASTKGKPKSAEMRARLSAATLGKPKRRKVVGNAEFSF